MSKCVWRLMMLVLLSALLACKGGNQDEVKNVARQFMSSLQQQDISRMRIYYPTVDNIDIFYASDTALITQVIKEDDQVYRVEVMSFYLNDDSQVEKKAVSLFIRPDSENRPAHSKYHIFDSYGLCSWNSYPHAKFAIHTGCLMKSGQMTDQQLVYRLRVAKDLLFYFSKLMYQDLEQNVRITQTILTQADGNMAHGRALVENRSDYTLPDLRYIIVYYDSNNEIVAEDKGWITKTPIESGQTVSFDFIPYYVSLVNNADFRIDFDMDLILQFVMDDDIYSGNEYEDFITKKLIDI